MTEKPENTPAAEKSVVLAPATSKPSRKKPAKRKKRAKAKSKGGRPPWKPTIDQRTTVEQMKFCGESDALIARSLGVDVDTLRKHCEVELADGYANRRRQVTGLLFEAAQKGNVSAIKRLDEMGKISKADQALRDRARASGGEGAGSAAAPVKPAKPEKVGKKEERKAAAAAITGKFAPPAAPKLVVNNQ